MSKIKNKQIKKMLMMLKLRNYMKMNQDRLLKL